MKTTILSLTFHIWIHRLRNLTLEQDKVSKYGCSFIQIKAAQPRHKIKVLINFRLNVFFFLLFKAVVKNIWFVFGFSNSLFPCFKFNVELYFNIKT